MNRTLLAALIGLGLVAVTFAGVRMSRGESVLPFGGKTEPAVNPSADDGPAYVVVWGYVDGIHGWSRLSPEVPGRVVTVAREYTYDDKQNKTVPTRVKKGDLLLQIDDTLAQLKVKEAQVAAEAAKTKLTQAQQYEKQYPLKVASQEAAVKAVQKQRVAAQQKQAAEKAALQDVSPFSKAKLAAYEAELEAVDARAVVEQKKLEELQLVDPKLEIALANDDLAAKANLVEQARKAVEKYQLRAPGDGVVLRVHVREGEILGPMAQQPALEFLSDESKVVIRGEVLQEWASRVKVGQATTIQDDTFQSEEWKGHVLSLSPYFTQTRTPVIEPFRQNDVRTQECIIEIDAPHEFRIGQRMRVKIKI